MIPAAWEAVFVTLSVLTVLTGRPSWAVTVGGTLLATVVMVVLELRMPGYRGMLWERINPTLWEWWEELDQGG